MAQQRRDKGEGTIFRRKDGTWEARLKINDKPRARRAKTEKEARQKLKELKSLKEEEERRTTLNFNDLTVNEYFDMFLEYKKDQRGFDRISYMRLESTINTHIKPFFEYTNMSDLTGELIQERLDEAKESGNRNGGGLAHSSVKKIYDAFKACYDFAIRIKKDIRPENNPMFLVQMIPKKEFTEESKDIRYLLADEDNNERERFVNEALRKHKTGRYVYKFGPALVFIMCTGLREGEMCGLGRKDIYLKDKYIHVHDNAKTIKDDDGSWKTIIVSDDVKYNSERYVPLNDKAIEMLKIIYELYPENDKTERLIYSKHETTLPPLELNKTFNRICIGAEIGNMDGVGPHCLRHTFATSLFEQGVKVPVVSELLGHSSVEVTQNIYISITKKLKVKAMSLINI